jgi:hypothetical protein
MKKLLRPIRGVALGALITPFAAMLAIASSGAGHGDYILARVMFPYGMLLTRLVESTFFYLLIGLALAQFPFYGALVVWRTDLKKSVVTAFAIAAVHLMAVVACFSGFLPNFSWRYSA